MYIHEMKLKNITDKIYKYIDENHVHNIYTIYNIGENWGKCCKLVIVVKKGKGQARPPRVPQ